MPGPELKFLGDFEVRRDGRALKLPPSKKTRALLAYLALQPRRFRREHLCELLWEVPDDPRGSLRWSLSKLRRLVDDADRLRIVADRDSVSVDTEDLLIDVRELRRLVADDLAQVPVETLEAAVARHRGNFLEGLEFSSFHDFHTWCVAEREQSLRDRGALLAELVARVSVTPERALPHARALVGLAPYDEEVRANLIRLLQAARQPAEAEEQFRLGLRMLKEAGVAPSGALQAARLGPRIDVPHMTAVRLPEVPRPAPPATGLIGRDTESAAIAKTLARVIDGSCAAVLLLRGAPGIGKTRVLEQAIAMARERNAYILQAAAFESDAFRPFAMWIDSLRACDAAAHDRAFGHDDVVNRDRLFAGLSELVRREAAEHPVMVAFDDLQWCDESSAAALHYVARMNRDRPFLGVFAARDSELRDNVPVQQALRGLRRDGVVTEMDIGPLPQKLLKRLIDERAPGADSERLSLDCGGNPLLAIELARAESSGVGGGTLDDLIRERLERFGTTCTEVLQWAAVLSPRIGIATLVGVTGLQAAEVGRVLEDAERQALLVAGDHGLRFAHDLVARAVYNEISPIRRQVMHRRVAELLEEDASQDLARAADLAHHAVQSEDRGLAARALVSAGRLCLRFFSNDDAASLARKGLQLARQLPDNERACLEVDLNDILLTAGVPDDWGGAAEKYTALAERALDHGALAHARLGYHMAAYVRWAQGRWSDAREQTLQAARVVRGGADEAHIVGLADTAKCLVMIERDLSLADAMLMEAAALAERKRFSYHAICAGLGMLRFHENRLDEAGELFREARTLSKSAGDRICEFQANEYLTMLDLQQGRVAEARVRCGALLALAGKLSGGSEEPFARSLDGLCTYAMDDDAQPLDTALEDLRIADAKHRLAYVLTRAALIDRERGRNANAAERAREALEYARLLERATETRLASAILASAHGVSGDRAQAARFAAESSRLESVAAVWAEEIVAGLLAPAQERSAAMAKTR